MNLGERVRHWPWSLCLILVGVLALTGVSQTLQATPKRILKVGLIFKFAEEYDGTVPAMANGVATAVAMYKAIDPNMDVVVTRFPHQRDLSTVLQAIDAAIKAKVDVVIGGEDSNHAIPMAEKLGKAGILFISPTATNPKVTAGKPLAFAASMSDEHVATKVADFVARHLKAERVGVMRGISSPYTDYISQRFGERLAEIKKDVVGMTVTEEKFVRGMMSFADSIKVFQAARVSHLAMLSYETEFMQLVMQMQEVEYFPVLIGADGWGSAPHIHERLFKSTGAKAPKNLIAFQAAYWRDDPAHALGKQFVARYKKDYGAAPTPWSAVAFDAAWVVLNGARNAAKTNKTPSAAAIAAEMAGAKPMPVATTDAFFFAPERSPIKTVPMYRIDAAGYRYEASY